MNNDEISQFIDDNFDNKQEELTKLSFMDNKELIYLFHSENLYEFFEQIKAIYYFVAFKHRTIKIDDRYEVFFYNNTIIDYFIKDISYLKDYVFFGDRNIKDEDRLQELYDIRYKLKDYIPHYKLKSDRELYIDAERYAEYFYNKDIRKQDIIEIYENGYKQAITDVVGNFPL